MWANGKFTPTEWVTTNLEPTSELKYGRIKVILANKLHEAITSHDVVSCCQLLRLLAKETVVDPYILFRLIMILIESNSTRKLNKNVVMHLETQINKLHTLAKPEVFVEFLTYFLKNNQIDDFIELYNLRNKYMMREDQRKIPIVIINMQCYEFLSHYIRWQDKDDDREMNKSIQGWLVNLMETLRFVNGNYEYFLLCLLKVLFYYGYEKKAYLFVTEYFRNNPCNLSAQLIMYKLMEYFQIHDLTRGSGESRMDHDLAHLEERRQKHLKEINNFPSPRKDTFRRTRFPVEVDFSLVKENIKKLDPTNEVLINLSKWNLSGNNPVEQFEIIMNGLEYLNEICNPNRWLSLKILLDQIREDEQTLDQVKEIWRDKYMRYWRYVNFIEIIGEKADVMDMVVVEEVIKILHTFNPDKDIEPMEVDGDAASEDDILEFNDNNS